MKRVWGYAVCYGFIRGVATVATIAVYLTLKPLGQSIATTILALATAYAVLLVLKILRKEELQTITKTILIKSKQ